MGYISHIWGADTFGPISTKIGTVYVYRGRSFSPILVSIFVGVSYLQGVKFFIFPLTLLVIVTTVHCAAATAQTVTAKNKRRAVAAQTARIRCKFQYALFRDYRHIRASRLLESESVDSSILKF